jgi:hypothetical protein
MNYGNVIPTFLIKINITKNLSVGGVKMFMFEG